MNKHFIRDYPREWRMPTRVFARLDHVERPNPGEWTVLLAFDAVDADWLLNRGLTDERFDLNDPDRALAALSARPLKPVPQGQGVSPFDDAPLYRIDIEHPLGHGLFGYGQPDFIDTGRADSGLGALEAAWFVLELTLAQQLDGRVPASVYPSLFSLPATAFVKGTMPSVPQGKALSGIFSLATLPTISTAQLEKKLAVGRADLLAAYDVGQGNSNALLEEHRGSAAPTLYYDLGAGVYRNQHTTPTGLRFCFTYRPPILLSHWDADHWAGTYATSINGNYPALQQDWYAPLQTVGPVHVAFAHDVFTGGGSMSTYAPPLGAIGASKLSTGQTLRFTCGSGSDRNNTGIVVAVEDDALQPGRSWILTGDCDYDFFMSTLLPHPPVGLVAPHHGADLASGVNAPAPVALVTQYCRLVYSFGAGNRHGKKQHPTTIGMQLHNNPGWKHGSWSLATPGQSVAGADVLHTEVHGGAGTPAGPLGGCLVGWDQKPSPIAPNCGGGGCTISPVQR